MSLWVVAASVWKFEISLLDYRIVIDLNGVLKLWKERYFKFLDLPPLKFTHLFKLASEICFNICIFQNRVPPPPTSLQRGYPLCNHFFAVSKISLNSSWNYLILTKLRNENFNGLHDFTKYVKSVQKNHTKLLVNDTTLSWHSPLRFRKNVIEWI